jgi:SAM-dependent methyltransferase
MSAHESHLDRNVATFGTRDEEAEFAWQRWRIETICNLIRDVEPKNLAADIGCMGGLAARAYVSAGIGSLHGFDIAEGSLGRLRAKGFVAHRWNADGERCPADDETYDLVIAGEIIEHIVDTDSFVRELYRVLKPGGHLILTTPNLASWYNRVRLARGLPPLAYPAVSSSVRRSPLIDLHHIRVNVLSEWTTLLQHHGFAIARVEGASILGVLEGGWRTRIIKLIDRVATRRPSLAVNLVILATKAAASVKP